MKSGKKGRKSRRRQQSDNIQSDGDDVPVSHVVSTAFDAPEVSRRNVQTLAGGMRCKYVPASQELDRLSCSVPVLKSCCVDLCGLSGVSRRKGSVKS